MDPNHLIYYFFKNLLSLHTKQEAFNFHIIYPSGMNQSFPHRQNNL